MKAYDAFISWPRDIIGALRMGPGPGRSSRPGQAVGRLARQAGAEADDRRADGTSDRRRGGLGLAADCRLSDLLRAPLVDQPELDRPVALHLVLNSLHSAL